MLCDTISLHLFLASTMHILRIGNAYLHTIRRSRRSRTDKACIHVKIDPSFEL